MIDVKNVTKRFGATVAVDNVSFQVRKGEILGFLGPNGAGKSTTMRVITSYLIPDEGTATVGGYDVITQPLEVRKRIGYLPESIPLYNEMRVDEYLRFVAEARQIPPEKRRERIQFVIERVALKAVVKKNCGNLSRGYRQRVGVAQALIHDPPVLVLDEPTTGLDPHQIIEIRDLIRDLSQNKAVIFSTHILQEIEAICSRIVIIQHGRIAADGTPGELARQTLGGIRIKGRIRAEAEQVRQALSALDGAKEVSVAPQDGACTFNALFEQGDDPGAILGALAQERGWAVLESTTEYGSLEDVYLAITRRS